MDFFNWICEGLESIYNSLLDILPKSPIVFLQENETVSEYLGYVNYFIPIYLWISILEAWLSAILVYYAFKLILRWIKME
jgi:hypothetical protein